MRFLDANVFIYAYYKPKKQLTQEEKQMREHAKRIISAVSEGKEDAMITVVNLSEIVNILKHGVPLDQLSRIVRGLFMLDNAKITGVTRVVFLWPL
jgi:predicted nucleic acid-binding protein